MKACIPVETTLLKTALVRRLVFRLLYCLSLPRTSEDRLTSLLS